MPNKALVLASVLSVVGGATASASERAYETHIEFCNQTSQLVTFAMAYQIRSESDDWQHFGWYQLAGGECDVRGFADSPAVYVYGFYEANPSQVFGGNQPMCVQYPGPFQFSTDRMGACPSGQRENAQRHEIEPGAMDIRVNFNP